MWGELLWLFTDVTKNATVHIEDQAVNEVRRLRRQEHRRAHQVLGSAPAGCGSLGQDELVKGMAATIGLDLSQGSGLRGGNVAGA